MRQSKKKRSFRKTEIMKKKFQLNQRRKKFSRLLKHFLTFDVYRKWRNKTNRFERVLFDSVELNRSMTHMETMDFLKKAVENVIYNFLICSNGI